MHEMLCFAGQNASRKMDREACPADGFGIRSFLPESRLVNVLASSPIVYGNSVSADRIVMAASRLLGAAAECVMLLCLSQLDIVNRIGVAASRL